MTNKDKKKKVDRDTKEGWVEGDLKFWKIKLENCAWWILRY